MKIPGRELIARILLLGAVAGSACAQSAGELERGSAAPGFTLPDVDGKERSLAEAPGQPAILLFGELYNRNTIAALADLEAALRQPALEGAAIPCFFILGTQEPSEKIRKDWSDISRGFPASILLDRRRTVFESHRVKVLPSLVLLDSRHQVSLTMSGYPLNFTDIVTDGLLQVTGKLDPGRLEERLPPGTAPGAEDPRLRATRMVRMAAALSRRGLIEMAMARYQEAAALDPQLAGARLGLADVLFGQGRIQESQGLYEEALALAPGSTAAHAGLARIEIKRDQIDRAEKRLREQIALHPIHAELRFLLGETLEKRGRRDEALSEFKRAASILLVRAKE